VAAMPSARLLRELNGAGDLVSLDLGPDVRSNCTGVRLDSPARTYTCTAYFSEAGPRSISATYSGDWLFKPATQTIPTTVTSGPVQEAFVPSSGPAWQDGQPPVALDVPGLPPGAPKQIASTHTGRLLAIGSDGKLYTQQADPFGGTRFVPVPMTGGPANVTRVAADDYEPNGDMQIMEIGTDRLIYHRILHGNGTWDPWTRPDQGNVQGQDISIGIDGGGDLHVAMIGGDFVPYTRIRYTNGVWSGWQAVPQSNGALLQVSRVALVVDRNGATNGRVSLASTTAKNGTIMLSYQNRGQPFAPAVLGPPAPPGTLVTDIGAVLTHLTVNGSDSIVHLLGARATDGQLYRWIATNGTWTPPKPVPTPPGWSGIAAATVPGGVSLITWP
jgi:hypothetical protein